MDLIALRQALNGLNAPIAKNPNSTPRPMSIWPNALLYAGERPSATSVDRALSELPERVEQEHADECQVEQMEPSILAILNNLQQPEHANMNVSLEGVGLGSEGALSWSLEPDATQGDIFTQPSLYDDFQDPESALEPLLETEHCASPRADARAVSAHDTCDNTALSGVFDVDNFCGKDSHNELKLLSENHAVSFRSPETFKTVVYSENQSESALFRTMPEPPSFWTESFGSDDPVPVSSNAVESNDDNVIVISDDDDDLRIVNPTPTSNIFTSEDRQSLYTVTENQSVPTPYVPSNNSSDYNKTELKALVENNNLSADATEEIQTPSELSVELMRHQRRAVAWMIKRETHGAQPVMTGIENGRTWSSEQDDSDEEGDEAIAGSVDIQQPCLGGILADEQGLGKTLSVIGLLVANHAGGRDNPVSYLRTLIVCPLSLVSQWRDELTTKIREEYRPKVYIYHGPKRVTDPSKLSQFDVVITTYSTITNEYPKVLRDDVMFAYNKKAKLPLPRRSCGPLFMCHWERVVLDEAHYIKNCRTGGWAAAMQLPSSRRWCLTGTPIQNNVDDIYSLFCFIRYRFMSSLKYKEWNQKWKKKLESSTSSVRSNAFKRFQAITGVVTLRRTKQDSIDGRPLITLPDRECKVEETSFRYDEERALYRALEQNSVLELEKFMSQGGLRQNYSGIMVLLLRLRQACCHPSLIEHAARKSRARDPDTDDIDVKSPFTADEIDRTRELLENGISAMDLLSSSAQQAISSRFRVDLTSDGSDVEEVIGCEQCHAIVDQNNLRVHPSGSLYCETCVNLYLTVTFGSEAVEDPFVSLTDIRLELFVKALEARRLEHREAKFTGSTKVGSTRTFAYPAAECERARKKLKAQKEDGSTSDSGSTTTTSTNASLGCSIRELGCNDAKLNNQHKNESKLCNDDMVPVGIEKPSTKIDVILSVLQQMRARNEEEKCLIFSQWTSMLDIIGLHLTRAGLRYCRLDGTMVMSKRKEEIQRFKSDKHWNIFLISMHAGGMGTSKEHIYIYVYVYIYNFSGLLFMFFPFSFLRLLEVVIRRR